jgi:hypothetical protein
MAQFTRSANKLFDLLALRCVRYGWTLATQAELMAGSSIRDVQTLRNAIRQLVDAGVLEVRDFTVGRERFKRAYRLPHVVPQDERGAQAWGKLASMAAQPTDKPEPTVYGVL